MAAMILRIKVVAVSLLLVIGVFVGIATVRSDPQQSVVVHPRPGSPSTVGAPAVDVWGAIPATPSLAKA